MELSRPEDETESITLDLPDDVVSALAAFPEYRKAFEALSPQQKDDLTQWIDSARDPGHRRQRLDATIRSLR